MTWEDSVRQMERVRGDVERRVRTAEEAILELAAAYRFLGRTFTFSFNGDLDTQVNEILLGLSNALRGDNDARIMQTISDAESDLGEVMEYVNRRQGEEDRTERYDRWCSRLRDLIEAWAAACFACGLDAAGTISEMRRWRRNPAGAGVWGRSGVPAPAGYGSGLSSDIEDGLTLTGQNSINEAFQLASLAALASEPGVTGYRVVRGSSFDCGACDGLCSVVHPLSEICLPAHPRCLCRIVPVYGVSDGDWGP